MRRGKFIVLEGLDATGKTTKLEFIRDLLLSRGVEVYLTAEPTDSCAGKLLREVLSGVKKLEPAALSALFLSDRVQHCVDPVDGIKAHLERGETVISSRYYYSTFAYQGMDADLDWIIACNRDNPYVIKPDLCVFLEAPPEVCVARINRDREADRVEIFENVQTLRRVLDAFDRVFALLDDNVVRIDTDRPPEAANLEIKAAVDALFDT